MNETSLIYGKDETAGVVSIEVDNDEAVLFVQDQTTGSVFEVTYENFYWILASKGLEGFQRLDGNLHYNHVRLLRDRESFNKLKRAYQQEHNTFHVNDAKESFMLFSGVTYYKGLQHRQVSTLAFDIETVGLEMNADSRILIISNTYRDAFGNVERKLFAYDEFEDAKTMLDAWCDWVQEKDPSIMLGHNIYNYDLPYIAHCASLCGSDLLLGRKRKPIQFNPYTSKFRKDGSQFYEYRKCFIYGREIVDTMFLALKYDVGRKYESYGLKAIIKHEGLEVEGRQFYDAGQIRYKFEDKAEWEKIKKYAEHDGDDALALYDLMSPPFFYMTQSVPKSFQEVNTSASGSQINSVMMRAYLQDGHSIPYPSQSEPFEGAISLGNPGIYRNVMKVDVASLYPSIMIQYQVCDERKDPRRYFSQLVETFTKRRLEHKKLAKVDKYHDDMQGAFKIFINSCYGFLGATGLCFNSPKNAAFVTRTGREVLNHSINWAESKGFLIANADTDSISFCRADMAEIPEAEQKSLLEELNKEYPARIRFEHDGYFPAFVVLKAKNYILFDGKKIKTKGSALKDQKKELALLEFINRIISEIVHGTAGYKEVYESYVEEILNVQDIKRWSSKKTITDKVLNNDRTNEVQVRNAIAGTDYREADKVWLFYKSDETLCLAEKFDGDYNKVRLLKKLYMTSQVFESVLPVDDIFINYSLKKNQKLLVASGRI